MTTDQERFAKRVHPAPNGCHLWTGAIDADGYGTFNVNGKKVAAHIYAFGEVPEGHELDHLCHNADLACPGDATCLHRRCTNKAHLEAVTHAVNLQRRHERAARIETASTSVGIAVNVNSSANPFAVRGFRPGYDPRRSTAGRPKKGESLLAYTRKLVEKASNKQAVAEAKLDRLLDRGSVGNRAWAEYRDTFEGVPKQTLVLEQGEAPADALDARLAALLQGHNVIEGESRVIADVDPAT